MTSPSRASLAAALGTVNRFPGPTLTTRDVVGPFDWLSVWATARGAGPHAASPTTARLPKTASTTVFGSRAERMDPPLQVLNTVSQPVPWMSDHCPRCRRWRRTSEGLGKVPGELTSLRIAQN